MDCLWKVEPENDRQVMVVKEWMCMYCVLVFRTSDLRPVVQVEGVSISHRCARGNCLNALIKRLPRSRLAFWDFQRSLLDHISLLSYSFFFFFFCCCYFLGRPSSKKPKAPSFQIGSGWKYASVFSTFSVKRNPLQQFWLLTERMSIFGETKFERGFLGRGNEPPPQ